LSSLGADAFTTGKLVQGQQRQLQVGNSIYNMVPLDFSLKPIKAGTLNLGPAAATVVVDFPSGNRRRDPLEQFGFRSFFGEDVEQKQLTVASEPDTIKVLPLPSTNVPPGFSGAVGSYTMTFSAGPTNVAVGDPITIKVQIAGTGDLDAITLPEQSS